MIPFKVDVTILWHETLCSVLETDCWSFHFLSFLLMYLPLPVLILPRQCV